MLRFTAAAAAAQCQATLTSAARLLVRCTLVKTLIYDRCVPVCVAVLHLTALLRSVSATFSPAFLLCLTLTLVSCNRSTLQAFRIPATSPTKSHFSARLQSTLPMHNAIETAQRSRIACMQTFICYQTVCNLESVQFSIRVVQYSRIKKQLENATTLT